MEIKTLKMENEKLGVLQIIEEDAFHIVETHEVLRKMEVPDIPTWRKL